MARSGLRFWIVDDDLSFGRSLKRMLNAKGIPAEYFESAQSFLDAVSPGQSGYAIVDIHMPGCGGFELLKKMQALNYRMPVILVTGQADSDAPERAAQGGAAGYLQKPFSEETLFELIHSVEED